MCSDTGRYYDNGRVDQRIHTKSQIFMLESDHEVGSPTLLDVKMLDLNTMRRKCWNGSGKYNSGKGPIVDSGTTDTYLLPLLQIILEAIQGFR